MKKMYPIETWSFYCENCVNRDYFDRRPMKCDECPKVEYLLIGMGKRSGAPVGNLQRKAMQHILNCFMANCRAHTFFGNCNSSGISECGQRCLRATVRRVKRYEKILRRMNRNFPEQCVEHCRPRKTPYHCDKKDDKLRCYRCVKGWYKRNLKGEKSFEELDKYEIAAVIDMRWAPFDYGDDKRKYFRLRVEEERRFGER